MELKTILNRVYLLPVFVYGTSRLVLARRMSGTAWKSRCACRPTVTQGPSAAHSGPQALISEHRSVSGCHYWARWDGPAESPSDPSPAPGSFGRIS